MKQSLLANAMCVFEVPATASNPATEIALVAADQRLTQEDPIDLNSTVLDAGAGIPAASSLSTGINTEAGMSQHLDLPTYVCGE